MAALLTPIIACASAVDDDAEGSNSNSLSSQCELGEVWACDPGSGARECVEFDDGTIGWSECERQCEQVVLPAGSGTQTVTCCTGDPCYTPLVMAFDNQRVAYHTTMTGSFDLTGYGMSLATDWPTAATPWLALDRNGNGRIDSGSELFGSATVLSSGYKASNGFVALEELDSNHDGRIDPQDAKWSQLVLWADRDANRASGSSEISTLSSHQLLWISLDHRVEPYCVFGNCERERATFAYRDANGVKRRGTVIDIYLAAR